MHPRSPVCGACAVLALLFLSPSVSAQGLIPTITFAEGSGTIISGAHGYLPAAGVRLRQCDIVRTGPRAGPHRPSWRSQRTSIRQSPVGQSASTTY